ncbi:MAG: 23S rRNA (adenine(2030)-N(6))-methyltransferase RlmJ [Myxococcota bacterium]
MLSYRHGYHAGNHADVLKHAVFVHILEHLKKKGPFAVVDTHAGPGVYNLADTHAQKLREFAGGVERVLSATGTPPLIARYLEVVRRFRDEYGTTAYPGTAALALALRRPGDRIVFHELHPTDVEALRAFARDQAHTSVHAADGFKGLLAHVPPPERRGVAVMDPSYEIKTDYERATAALLRAHRKFATGVFILWYPVVRREWVNAMDQRLAGSGVRKVLRLELAVAADTAEHGMTASGVYVINPPYTLPAAAADALPWLAEALGGPNAAHRCEWLAPE